MASIYHALRGLEPGLYSLARHMAVPGVKNNDNWGKIIDSIETYMNANTKNAPPRYMKNLQFYSQAVVQFRHFNNAYRKDTMHLRADLDMNDAKTVRDAVREFMGYISEHGLKERRS